MDIHEGSERGKHSGVYPASRPIRREAAISDCGNYRYRLSRSWDASSPPLPFIMLNPSTADANLDDPTIRRCVGFAVTHGFGGIAVRNLYAFRATKPVDLWRAAASGVDIAGPDNDRELSTLFDWARSSGTPVVAAWGANAKPERVAEVLAIEPDGGTTLHHLGLTKSGVPRHPLMLRGDARLTPWLDR